jgi:hypothetical protein
MLLLPAAGCCMSVGTSHCTTALPQWPLGLAAGYKDVADSGYFYSGASIVAPRTMGGQAAAARIPVKWRMNEPWITPVSGTLIAMIGTLIAIIGTLIAIIGAHERAVDHAGESVRG